MNGNRSLWRLLRDATCTGLIAPGLLTLLAGSAVAQTVALPAPPAVAVVPAPAPLDLAAAKALALQKQPAVAAARASLAAAVARKQALDNLRVPTFLQRDLPVRRQQAAVGLQAAEAGVKIAELDTVYAVHYAYVSYLYARTQLQYVENAIAGLEQLRSELADNIKRSKKENGKEEAPADDKLPPPTPRTDLREDVDLARIDALLAVAQTRREEAAWGAKRALAALREAMGVPADCHLVPVHDRLFDVCVDLDCGKLVQLALALRPEIVAAAVGVEVTGLEVTAQGLRCLPLSLRTFASGSDIHAVPLPAVQTDGGYRPGAVAPEMPVTLSGKRADRVHTAALYQDRAATVLDKTRHLVQLQTEQAYLRYRAAKAEVAHFERAAERATHAQRYTVGHFFRSSQDVATLTQVFATGQLASDSRAAAYQARYQMLLALIELEHHTGAGFRVELEKAALIAPPPAVKLSAEERRQLEEAIDREKEGKKPE